MSERSGGREQSEQSGASERVNGANGQASGPVLTSRFLFVPDHSGMGRCVVKGVERSVAGSAVEKVTGCWVGV